MSVRSTYHLPLRLLLATMVAGLLPAQAEPIISEFLAANDSSIVDEDGSHADWIEIHNPDGLPVNLGGWHLTDNAARKTKWTFPAVVLPPQGYLVVFASGKNRLDTARPLHTNFSLDADGEYLALVRPDGSTVTTELEPAYPAQYPDVSYGIAPSLPGAAGMTFLRQPTPGAANAAAGTPVAGSSVVFSQPSGTFSSPFVLALSGAGSDERIRYLAVPITSQGAAPAVEQEPTVESPEYTGPLAITESVIVRAAVFSADDRQRGPSATAHFLRLPAGGADRADGFNSALPVVVLGLHGYGSLDANGTRYYGWVHLFESGGPGPVFGAEPDLSSAARLRVRGNSSAQFPKKGYSINLLDSEGDERRESLLGLASSDEWALISPWNYDRTYIHNALAYAISNSLGRWAPRTRFVEVFADGDGTLRAGDYAGISILTERIQANPDRLNIQDLSPADLSPDDITGGYILKIDVPDVDEWSFITKRNIPDMDSAQVVVVNAKADKLPPAQREYIRGYVQSMEDALAAGEASGWNDRSYLDYIDVDSWVDQHLMQVFFGNLDAITHSDYFHKDRGGRLKAGPVWDFDRAMGSYDPRNKNWDTWDVGPVEVWTYYWYGMIARDPEFMQAWIDRWQSLRTQQLSAAAIRTLADGLAAQVTPEAAARDAARWPDNVSPTGRGFSGEIARLKDWLTQRGTWIDRQFVAPPTVAAQGGTITFTAPAGAVLAYTLDGSDPRALGGEIAPNARLTNGPLAVPATSNVHVRSYKAELKGVFPGSPWSSAVGGSASSPLAPRSRLVNISARGLVGAGEDALIAGVVVADTQAKRYLARAIGPGLAAFGASGTVADPQLSMFNAGGAEILRNNGWSNSPLASDLPRYAKSVGAFPLAPFSADSALAHELGRGLYTLQVTTPSRRPGIGLAELYELDGSGRTINLSTRALVGTGDNVLIGGFVVQGAAHKRMLIRGIGPTLTTFGVGNALQDPIITLYSGQTVVATNDRWSADGAAPVITAAARMVGAFPLAVDSEDAALLITVPPGAYTIEVKGRNQTVGVALLEIYDLP